ncbi:MAG: polynucleotide adenylyltransferase PcnB [Spirochaetia bacterium]
MLVRYKTLQDGSVVKQAEIYTRDEHDIDPDRIDFEARKIVRRLSSKGHTAYVVGGAVRDLLVGKQPKDFDIATDAAPGRIRKLFRNSRIIGKRFRLVHILLRDNQVIEVSTFRARESEGFQNIYGDIEDDALRRDFTLNALYYSPEDETILDYTGGFKDIRNRKVRPVIPVDRIFVEDPVRLIRAIKYSVGTDFRLTFTLRRAMKKSTGLLSEVSPSRMTEELFKILESGRSHDVFRQLLKFGIADYVVPGLGELVKDRGYIGKLMTSLASLDELIARKPVGRDVCLAYLCGDYLFAHSPLDPEARIPFPEAFVTMKQFLRPLVPPNRDIEDALTYLLKRKRTYLKTGRLDH